MSHQPLQTNLTAPASPRGAHALPRKSGKACRGRPGIFKSAALLCITFAFIRRHPAYPGPQPGEPSHLLRACRTVITDRSDSLENACMPGPRSWQACRSWLQGLLLQNMLPLALQTLHLAPFGSFCLVSRQSVTRSEWSCRYMPWHVSPHLQLLASG